MEAELHGVKFQCANDYYNNIVAVISRYEVTKLDTGATHCFCGYDFDASGKH